MARPSRPTDGTAEITASELLSLDTVNQCLWRGDRAIPIRPRAFAVLLYLAGRPRRLVTKDELLGAVWAGTHVTDAVLKVCVREIRQALDDDVASPRFIETAHRRGYRFIGELSRSEGPPPVTGRDRRTVAPDVAGSKPFVGRRDVLSALDRALERALDGHRSLAFLCGPPGIGKSTAVDAFLRQHQDRSSPWVARGQCIEQYGAGEAYLPVLDALGRLARGEHRERLLGWLERHAPTWLGPLGARADGSVAERDLLGATPQRMLREMAEAIESLSLATPLVLVLEDLHWSDFSTLDLIALLARRRDPARFLLIGTYRPEDVLRTSHPLRAVVQELATHGLCESLELEVLPPEAVEQYLDVRFDPHRFPPEFAATLHRQTEGNPLFLSSAVDFLLAEGSIAAGDGAWHFVGDLDRFAAHVPETIRQVIEMQVQRLSAEEQEVLAAGSVVGAEFSAIAAAAALERDLLWVEERCDDLAARQQLLRSSGMASFPDGSVSARYAFRHTLYRSVLYTGIAPSRRTRWHRRIGAYGEQLYGERAAEISAQLALHFEEAHEPARAVHHRRLAARVDARRHANREAVEHLARAGELAELIPEPQRTEARLEILEELGLVRRTMGDMRASSAAFEELAAAAARSGARTVQVRALLYLASTLFWVDRDRCLAAADRALDLARDLDDALLIAHVRGYCGHWNLNLRGFAPESVRDGQLAVEAARRAGARDLLALHVVRSAYARILEGRYDDAIDATGEGAELALAVGDGFDYLLCMFLRAWAQLHAGRWGDMVHTLSEGSALAEKNGHRLWLALLSIERSQLHCEAFDCPTARQLAQAAVGEARSSDGPIGQILFHGLIALAAACVGLGELDEAGACFNEIEQRLAERNAWMDWMLYFPLHRARAEWRLAAGDPAGAEAEAGELLRRAQQSGEGTYLVHAHRLRAEAALERGDGAAARREMAAARPLLERAPSARWRAYATEAVALRGTGRAAESADLLERAGAAAAALAGSLGPADPLGASLRRAVGPLLDGRGAAS